MHAATFALVAAGGALGSVARYLSAALVMRVSLRPFEWCTLADTGTGSLRSGVFVACVAVAILGGFTTFSAFSGQTLLLAQSQPVQAALYVGSSVLLCLAGAWLGYTFAR